MYKISLFQTYAQKLVILVAYLGENWVAGDQVLNGALVFIAYQFKPLILNHLNLSHLKNNKNYKPPYQTATFLHLEFLIANFF